MYGGVGARKTAVSSVRWSAEVICQRTLTLPFEVVRREELVHSVNALGGVLSRELGG